MTVRIRQIERSWGSVKGAATQVCVCVCVCMSICASVLCRTKLTCWLNFFLFLPQASRQFDQEGRKKFFTLDMNNILLEWVGQLLNHRQPDPSSATSSLSASLTYFQQLSLAASPAVLKCWLFFSPSLVIRVNYAPLISFPFSPFLQSVFPPLTLCHCPFVFPHSSLQSPDSLLSVCLSAFPSHHRNFYFPLISSFSSVSGTHDCFFLLSVSSCRSRSSLQRCVPTFTRTWRHSCRATKKPSSNAWRSSVSTSRWVRIICVEPEKCPGSLNSWKCLSHCCLFL